MHVVEIRLARRSRMQSLCTTWIAAVGSMHVQL